jgi:hypothetical protein
VVDHFTRGPLASVVIPANEQEYNAYERIFERASTNLGGHRPLIVAADAGYSVSKVFKFNSNNGVASAFPYRRGNFEPKGRVGSRTHDKYGIPKCKHCGAEGGFVRFSLDCGRGRLWYRCEDPTKPGCNTLQTIFCDTAPRYLRPVWRTDPAYQAMRNSHQSYEGKHADLAGRYNLAPKDFRHCPKRPGMAWQRLRASAALLVEWLRILQRTGLGSGPARAGGIIVTSRGTIGENLKRLRGASASPTVAPVRGDP